MARDLLTESGSCFVQIGDENVHLVRSLMDEVFGSENFVSQIAFEDDERCDQRSSLSGTSATTCSGMARDRRSQLKYRQLYFRRGQVAVDGSASG